MVQAVITQATALQLQEGCQGALLIATIHTTLPSRQVRILPGLGKVHIVHSYDRLVPYVGHKRLTVVTTPRVFSVRPSVIQRQLDWIENKVRPWVSYSATNNYLNSNSAVRIVYSRYPYYNSSTLHSSSLYPYYGSSYYSSYNNHWPLSRYWPRYSSYFRYWPLYRTLPYYLSSYWSDLSRFDSWYSWPHYRGVSYSDLSSSVARYTPYWSYYNSYLDNDRMVYVRSPLTGLYHSTYLPVPSSTYTNYYRIYRPLYSYDHWSLPSSWYSTYSDWWPKYRLMLGDSPSYRAYRLQRIFDDETRMIRAQSNALLKRAVSPVPRIRSWPVTAYSSYDWSPYPARLSNDNYINRLITISPSNKVEFTTYYSAPVKKYIDSVPKVLNKVHKSVEKRVEWLSHYIKKAGQGHLSCVSYVGNRGALNRRRNVWVYEDPVKDDIQLLSYYITKFKQDKVAHTEASKAALSPLRPSRKFTASKDLESREDEEMKKYKEERAARLAHIYSEEAPTSKSVEQAVKAKKQKEEARLAEEKSLAEQQDKKNAQSKKESEAARKAELARQDELAAQAAAERAAELSRQAELVRQEELAKQAEIERSKKLEEERAAEEERRRLEEDSKAEEERKQLLRLEEIARQAEEEQEADLVRQAEELAELARQEAELAEQAKLEAAEAERLRQEEELAELQRQEEELAELERKEKDLEEQAAQALQEAAKEAELAQLAKEEAELAELERQQAELDALEAEAKALEEPSNVEEEVEEEEEAVVDEHVPEDTEEPAVEELEEEAEAEEEPIAEAEEVLETNDDTGAEEEDE